MIRVTFAIGTLGNGGSEKQLTELLVRLPRDRFRPVLVTGAGEETTSHGRRLRSAGIEIIPVKQLQVGHPILRWAWRGCEYADSVRRSKPDVVYAWLDEAAAFLAPICRGIGIPCVAARRNLIGSDLERRYPVVGSAIRWAERFATLVTANSAAVAGSCVARGHDRSRIRLTPNGHLDLPPLPMPGPTPVAFGYVANFRPEKGHHRLIDALELLPAGGWRLDIAGDGVTRPEIQERVARAGMLERVTFLGAIDDAREFWRDRHVAMLLSDSEGMPNALLEAAFAGRAMIATDTGGTPEVVGDGGILVPLDDPRATVAAMQELIGDSQRRDRLGTESWRHAAETFSMDRMVTAHAAAITEAFASARHPNSATRAA